MLVTGFDIIFFWVARMIMMGLKFMGDVPFSDVYIHGLVRDQSGQKMSKSKGNVLDPLFIVDGVDLETLVRKRTEGMMQTHLKERIEASTRKEFPDGIAAYGADALRLTFASLATTGRDVSLDMGRVEGSRNFCNKLWNAAQYVFSHVQAPLPEEPLQYTIADRWIRSRLRAVIERVQQTFAEYRFDLATQALYEFTWHEFCDWYLEMTKTVLNDPEAPPENVQAAQRCLADVLGALLRLLHPVIPFVTEELWLKLAAQTGRDSETIMLEAQPRPESLYADPDAEAEIDWLKAFVMGVRQVRGEMSIAPGKRLPARLRRRHGPGPGARSPTRIAAEEPGPPGRHRLCRFGGRGDRRGHRPGGPDDDSRPSGRIDRHGGGTRPAEQANSAGIARPSAQRAEARQPEVPGQCAGGGREPGTGTGGGTRRAHRAAQRTSVSPISLSASLIPAAKITASSRPPSAW